MTTDNKRPHSEARNVIAAVVYCVLGAGIVCLVIALRGVWCERNRPLAVSLNDVDALRLEVAALRAEIAEDSGRRSPANPVLPVSETKANKGADLSSLPAPTSFEEIPRRECYEDWQRHIDGLLLRAEGAILAQRTNDAISLVHDAVQASLAADQNEIEIHRKARQVEQEKQDALTAEKMVKRENYEKNKQIDFNRQRQEEMNSDAGKNWQDEREYNEREYNERRRKGYPISPGEIRSGVGFDNIPPNDCVIEEPSIGMAELMSSLIQFYRPLPTPPGFPRLARLAEFVRESTGPELRALALAEIRQAALRFSAEDESEWRKQMDIATGANRVEFALPQIHQQSQ